MMYFVTRSPLKRLAGALPCLKIDTIGTVLENDLRLSVSFTQAKDYAKFRINTELA